MKKSINLILLSFFMVFSHTLFAQKLSSGSLEPLAGQKSVNIQFDYSKITIGDAASPFATNKGISEEEYVANKVSDLNSKKPGDGDRWAKAWVDDRTLLFQPSFLKALNDKLEKSGMVVSENNSEAKYTIIVKTVFIDAGYNVGVSKKDAHINLIIDIAESSDPSKIIASVEMKNVYKKMQASYNGMTFDFAVGQRLQACYDQAGISFGKFLVKNTSK